MTTTVVRSTKIYFFDVDDTLVFSCHFPPDGMNLGELDYLHIGGQLWYIHTAHTKLVMDLKARGHTVVVWSAGGWEWAEKVVEALHLTEYVDVVMSKSDGFCDDKPSSAFMSEADRFYIPIGDMRGGR